MPKVHVTLPTCNSTHNLSTKRLPRLPLWRYWQFRVFVQLACFRCSRAASKRHHTIYSVFHHYPALSMFPRANHTSICAEGARTRARTQSREARSTWALAFFVLSKSKTKYHRLKDKPHKIYLGKILKTDMAQDQPFPHGPFSLGRVEDAPGDEVGPIAISIHKIFHSRSAICKQGDTSATLCWALRMCYFLFLLTVIACENNRPSSFPAWVASRRRTAIFAGNARSNILQYSQFNKNYICNSYITSKILSL